MKITREVKPHQINSKIFSENRIKNAGRLKYMLDCGEYTVPEAIVEWYAECKLETHGDLIQVVNINKKTSIKAIIDLIEKDMQDISTVIEVINIALVHKFWKNNIYSLSGLRRKCSDGMMKYNHLRMQLIKRDFIMEEKQEKKKEKASNEPTIKLL